MDVLCTADAPILAAILTFFDSILDFDRVVHILLRILSAFNAAISIISLFARMPG